MIRRPPRSTPLSLHDALPILLAHVFNGDRYDVGNKLSYLETSIIYGLKHPETKDALRKYIINLGKKLAEQSSK